MTIARAWIAGGPALLALMQMAVPTPAGMAMMLVPICGEFGGRAVPIRLPRRDDPPGCKICHIAMRKRIGGDNCCDGEDNADAV